MSYITDSFDRKVVKSLKTGGVGFMPADTVYGLSCAALNEAAVDRIYRFKYRFEGKPFIILISNVNQLKALKIDPAAAGPIKKYWPGGITYICKAPKTPNWLQRGTKTLAVRLPDHEELRKLRSISPEEVLLVPSPPLDMAQATQLPSRFRNGLDH